MIANHTDHIFHMHQWEFSNYENLKDYNCLKNCAESLAMAFLPEDEDAKKHDSIDTGRFENVFFRGIPGALHPSRGRHQAFYGEGVLLLARVFHPFALAQQMSGEVHPGIRMLLPEHGVQGEEQDC